MEYLTIKESAEHLSKSVSTIRNYVRQLKATKTKLFEGETILKYKTLSNGAKQVYILKSYLDSRINVDTSVDMSVNRSIDTHIDTSLTSENSMLIESLKDHIESLKKELENRNKQIDEFLILEQKAIDRIQEQNHIIHQLNMIVEDNRTETINNKKEDFSEVDSVDFEHVQELNEKRSEILKEVLQKGERTFNEWLNGNQ